MSDTPRTDEITVVTGFLPAGEFVIPAADARAMERENAELRAQVLKMRCCGNCKNLAVGCPADPRNVCPNLEMWELEQ
jgi:hypothetical protein